jgi:hypothetical protein
VLGPSRRIVEAHQVQTVAKILAAKRKLEGEVVLSDAKITIGVRPRRNREKNEHYRAAKPTHALE